MAQVRTKSGAAIVPTTTNSGVSGTTPKLLTFPTPVRPVVVRNLETTAANVLKVKLNGTATTSDYDVIVQASVAQEVTFGGLVTVETISIWMDAGAYQNASAVGWD